MRWGECSIRTRHSMYFNRTPPLPVRLAPHFPPAIPYIVCASSASPTSSTSSTYRHYLRIITFTSATPPQIDFILAQPANQPASLSLSLDLLSPLPPRALPLPRQGKELTERTHYALWRSCLSWNSKPRPGCTCTCTCNSAFPRLTSCTPPPSLDWVGYLSIPIDIPAYVTVYLPSLPVITHA